MIVLSEEQNLIRDMASGWIADNAPLDSTKDDEKKRQIYSEMVQMGWPGIVVPEEKGGVGMGFVGLGLIAEEAGRQLVPSPLVSIAAGAVPALLASDDRAAEERFLARLLDGSLTAAMAIGPDRAADAQGIRAQKASDGGYVLDGSREGIADAGNAGVIIVEATLEDGDPALFACAVPVEGLIVTPLDRIDDRDAADLAFGKVKLPEDALIGRGSDYVEQVADGCRAVLAAEMLGSMVQAFETTIDYMKTRVQFDRPIGSFQALQHRAAELLGEIVLTRSAVYAALEAIDRGADDRAALVALAKSSAGEGFRLMSREMIQLHGGIGMTREHPAGLYLKRALAADALWGNAAYQRERFARLEGV